MTNRYATLVLNPISGRGAGLRWKDWIVSYFREAGYEPKLYVTQAKGDARRRAAQIRDDCALVVSIGGDGTLNEVVSGLQADVPVAMVPLGGANVMARELGVPLDVPRACAVATGGRDIRWDVGRAGDRRFLLMAGLGWDAHAVNVVHRRRSGPVSPLAYVHGALDALRHYRFPRIDLIVDDETETWGYSVVVGNARGYALGLAPTPLARPDDGLLDVVVLKERRTLHMLRYLWWALRQRLHLAGRVEYYRCRRVAAASIEPVPCQVDGDPCGWLPRAFTVEAGALRLVGARPAGR